MLNSIGFRLMILVSLAIPSMAYSAVYINDENAAVVDGKPFFPLGLYVGHNPASEKAIGILDEIADSPFNTIMNYGVSHGSMEQIREYLDNVDKRGLKIIYSLKDFYKGTQYFPETAGGYEGEEEMTRGIVSGLKDHPAILAWYLNDELSREYIPRLTERYNLVKELDPNHPAWIVLYQVRDLKHYLDTTDVLGTDPYPVPQKPVSMASQWTKLTREAAGPDRAVWMVTQAHNKSLYSRKGEKYAGPTFDEMRCMAYQCLVNGANGLVFYSFFDLKRDPLGFESRWADVKKLGEEIKSLIPVLLSTTEPPKVQLSSGSRNIQFLAKSYAGKLYILSVNISREEQDAEFVISGSVAKTEVLYEERTVDVENYRLVDRFPPIGVHIYEIEISNP